MGGKGGWRPVVAATEAEAAMARQAPGTQAMATARATTVRRAATAKWEATTQEEAMAEAEAAKAGVEVG